MRGSFANPADVRDSFAAEEGRGRSRSQTIGAAGVAPTTPLSAGRASDRRGSRRGSTRRGEMRQEVLMMRIREMEQDDAQRSRLGGLGAMDMGGLGSGSAATSNPALEEAAAASNMGGFVLPSDVVEEVALSRTQPFLAPAVASPHPPSSRLISDLRWR